MSKPLRKSCRACSRSKRRCNPQLPQCSRCRKAGIKCVYDLEPLSWISVTPTGPPSATESSYKLYDEGSPRPYYLFDDLVAAHEAATHVLGVHLGSSPRPEIRFKVDPGLLQVGVSYLRQIPELKSQGLSSPLVHIQLYRDRPESIRRINHALSLRSAILSDNEGDEIIVSPSQNIFFQHLVEEIGQSCSLSELLLFLDELTLYLIIYFAYDTPKYFQTEAESYINLLSTLATRLWSVLPNDLSNLSPWQAWLTAESTRRAILLSRFISIMLFAISQNYVIYSDFLEALPFDARQGLWEASSENEWQSLIHKYGGEATVLVSFHEFIRDFDDKPEWHGEGLFQRFLLMGKSPTENPSRDLPKH